MVQTPFHLLSPPLQPLLDIPRRRHWDRVPQNWQDLLADLAREVWFSSFVFPIHCYLISSSWISLDFLLWVPLPPLSFALSPLAMSSLPRKVVVTDNWVLTVGAWPWSLHIRFEIHPKYVGWSISMILGIKDWRSLTVIHAFTVLLGQDFDQIYLQPPIWREFVNPGKRAPPNINGRRTRWHPVSQYRGGASRSHKNHTPLIQVLNRRPDVPSFSFRLNSLEYQNLQDKVELWMLDLLSILCRYPERSKTSATFR